MLHSDSLVLRMDKKRTEDMEGPLVRAYHDPELNLNGKWTEFILHFYPFHPLMNEAIT